MTPVTAITGSTGFIGPHLVRRLLKTGHRLRLLVRRRPEQFETIPGDVELVFGDVRDSDKVEELIKGAKDVYHLAGCARAWVRDEKEYFETNVLGTKNVCEACTEFGVDRLIHMSTALTVTPPGQEYAPILTEYQRTKVIAEEVVQEHVDGGLHAVTVQPSRVFGPGLMSQANSATKMIDLYRRGLFRFRLSDGDARGNYLFVSDVVDAMIKASHSAPAGEQYPLGGEDLTVMQFIGKISEITGRNFNTIALPLSAARIVAFFAEAGGVLGIPPLISRDWTTLLSRDWPVDSSKAALGLDFKPKPVSEALALTLRWLDEGEPSIDFTN